MHALSARWPCRRCTVAAPRRLVMSMSVAVTVSNQNRPSSSMTSRKRVISTGFCTYAFTPAT